MADNTLTFVLSDESINSYGFRVLTSGIDLSLFKSNPIALWNHSRAYRGTTDEVLPLGTWDNIRLDGNKLLADVVFDNVDPFALSIKSKVEQGILRMASIGIDIIATSEDASVLEKGQTRPTVVKCRLTEASICDIGSNRNALKMCDEFGSAIELSSGAENHLLPLLKPKSNNNNMELKEQLATALKLPYTSDDAALLARLQALQTQNETLTARVTGYETQDQARANAAVTSLVDAAIKERRITESDRARYEKLAKACFEDTSAILAQLPAAADLSKPTAVTPTANGWEARFKEIKNSQR